MPPSLESLLAHRRSRRRRRWSVVSSFGVLTAGVALFGGCGLGETGDSCWSDSDCASGSCSWGSCDASLLELLFDIGSAIGKSDPPNDSPPAPPTPPARPLSCAGRSESECRLEAGCHWTVLCAFGVSAAPDAGTWECGQTYAQTRVCPSQCWTYSNCW